MTTPDDSLRDVASIHDGMAQTQVVAEAVGGYYRKLRESGIPEESAGRMAEEFHNVMMAQMIAGIKARAGQSTGPRGGRR